jgi:hypothetical protein
MLFYSRNIANIIDYSYVNPVVDAGVIAAWYMTESYYVFLTNILFPFLMQSMYFPKEEDFIELGSMVMFKGDKSNPFDFFQTLTLLQEINENKILKSMRNQLNRDTGNRFYFNLQIAIFPFVLTVDNISKSLFSKQKSKVNTFLQFLVKTISDGKLKVTEEEYENKKMKEKFEEFDLFLSYTSKYILSVYCSTSLVYKIFSDTVLRNQMENLSNIIINNFFGYFLNSHQHKIPVNLSEFNGSYETLKKIGLCLRSYFNEIERDGWLWHTLLSGDDDIINYFAYGIGEIIPSSTQVMVNINQANGFLERSISNSKQQDVINNFDNSGSSDFFILGIGPWFMRFVVNIFMQLGKVLSSNSWKFFFVDFNGLQRQSINAKVSSLKEYHETNNSLRNIDRDGSYSAIIGYANILDSAASSRFSYFIDYKQNFQSFLLFFRKEYINQSIENGQMLFEGESDSLDIIIYYLAQKLFSKTDNYQYARQLLQKLWFLKKQNVNMDFRRILNFF